MHRPRSGSLAVCLLFCAALASTAFCARAEDLSLDGQWNFLPDPTGALTVQQLASVEDIRTIEVPSSWQAQFQDLRDYAGVGWYWRSASLDPPADDQVILLRFGAVDYRATVFVNGQEVGTHEGGFLPFEFDVTPFWHGGTNQLAVRVVDAGGDLDEMEGIRFDEIPHGKQNWYVQTSGLWQSVVLEVRPRIRIAQTQISTSSDGHFKIAVRLAKPPAAPQPSPLTLAASILAPDGNKIWQAERSLSPGESDVEFTDHVSKPKVWSLEKPALHTLDVQLSTGDRQSYRFGFRTFEAKEGKFYLNGQVIYLRGALDQNFYPDTIFTLPSYEYVKNEMQKAKELGLNLLRFHIKVPDPRYLEAADEIGVLIWYDVPNWDKLTADSKRRGMETLRGMVERDWNHPCLVALTIINEAWGMDIQNPDHRRWLAEAYQEAKALVPGWLVVDNSPCCDNYHLVTDIADFHQYNVIPDNAAVFQQVVSEFARRAEWLFSPYGDATPKGDEPLVLSEFGNWGLPRLPEPKPWWWGRDFKRNPITLPAGVEERFSQHGFSSLFQNLDGLVDATQRHQYRALKYEIETLRAQPEIQGYVITEFTDINWEANGLLDMWRQPKLHGELIRSLHSDDLVLAQASRRNYTSGDRVSVGVYFSHYGATSWPDARVRWSLENTSLSGELPFPLAEPGEVVVLSPIEFIAPRVAVPTRRMLVLRAMAGTTLVSENTLELFFYPRNIPDSPPAVLYHDPLGSLRPLRRAMRLRNYREPNTADLETVVISSTFDEETREVLAEGGRVILLARERDTLAPGLEVLPRANSNLEGNWITSFLWVRRGQGPFTSLSFEELSGFEVQAVAPPTVVQGIPPQKFADVLSGIFYGWIHSNVGTLIQARYGKGRLLICTLDLANNYGSDPYATFLLDELIRYALSDFSPTLNISSAEQPQ